MINFTTLKKSVPEPPGLAGYGTSAFEIRTLETTTLRTMPSCAEQVIEVIWLTKGRFQIMLDMETYEVSDGMIVFLTPGQAFYIRSVTPDLEGLVLRFPAGFMPTDFDLPYPDLTYLSPRIFHIDDWTATSLKSVVECICWELRNAHARKAEILSGYVKIVLIYLAGQRSVVLRSSYKADMALLAKRFFNLLERQYHVNKKVSEYADELAVTPSYLNQIVKRETGMSVSANIRRRLLLQAKRMALIQDISMKTVAYKLGFDDTSHFSKFFKMGCGCNFTTYRKMRPGSYAQPAQA